MLINLLLFLLPLWTLAHPFHVSKALVEYNAREKVLQVSMHLFVDDLEEALRQEGAEALYLCTDREAPDADQLLEAYLSRRFSCILDGKPRKFAFLGKEPSEDLLGAWCYLEIASVPPPKKLEIHNSVLTELFEDQKNIVHLIMPGLRERTYLLSRKQTKAAMGVD